MDRTLARHAGQSLRLRTVAGFVLALLFGLQLAPLARAQAATVPDCCMAAEGKGCSMHLHRATQAGHSFAAVQPRCPCPSLVPASVGAQSALSLSASQLDFSLASERAALAQSRSLRGAQAVGSGGTRGPPAMTLAA